MAKKSEQPRNTPKPGHRAPGGIYVGIEEGWSHIPDTTTGNTDSTPPSDTSSSE